MKKLLLFLVLFIPCCASAQKGVEINLWPDGPVSSNDDPNDMAKMSYFYQKKRRQREGLLYVVLVVDTLIWHGKRKEPVGLHSLIVRA